MTGREQGRYASPAAVEAGIAEAAKKAAKADPSLAVESLWVSEWPRSLVYPGFLSPVLLSTGIQRSSSLICTLMRSDAAARDIHEEKFERISDHAQRAKVGQIEDACQTAEYHDVLQQEAVLTTGHGILLYTGLIAVSVPTIEELDVAVAATEQAAIQASCETRLLVVQQAAAFTAAALPLCLRV